MDTENPEAPTRRIRSRKPRPDARTIARRCVVGIGLAAAVGFGGFAAHEALFTDAPAQAHAAEVLDSITAPVVAEAAKGGATDRTAITSIAPEVPSAAEAQAGEAFGSISSPLFGTQPLVKSDQTSSQATQDIIDTGVVAAYESRENPGEAGNFAVIGHRITHGSVFNRAPELRKGNEIKVSTVDGDYTYRVIQEAFRVGPKNNTVLDSNPLGDAENTDRALMSIITCGDWLTNHREVIVLELVPED